MYYLILDKFLYVLCKKKFRYIKLIIIYKLKCIYFCDVFFFKVVYEIGFDLNYCIYVF